MNTPLRTPSWLGQTIRAVLVDQTLSNSVTVLAGQIGRLLLGLVSSALLARSLGPSGLAAYAVVGSTLMIAVAVADFGLGQSAVRQIAGFLKSSPADARETAGTFARWKLVVGLSVCGLMLATASPLAAFLDLPSATGPTLIGVAAAGLAASVLGSIPNTILHAQSRFRPLIGNHLLNAGLTVLLMGLLFLAGRLAVIPALWVGAFTALAAAALSFYLLAPVWRRAVIMAGSLRGRHGRQMLAFGKWLWLSAVLTILTAQADLLMVNRMLPSETAGYYALALNLSFKADILNQTMYTVLLPVASALSDRAQYLSYLKRNLIRSLVLTLPLILAWLAAPLFIRLVYGSAFSASSPVFRWMLLVAALDLLFTPISLLAFPLNLPRSFTAANVARVGLLLLLGSQLIPLWGLVGAVVAKFVAKAAGGLFLGIVIARHVARPGLDGAAAVESAPEDKLSDRD
jgi:O-antigen/teichoic acid export membrane protein